MTEELSLDCAEIIRALCDPENQPHLWVSDPGKLLGALYGCKQNAGWVIYDQEPYMETYSCNEHLSDMVADSTTVIRPVEDGGECCFITHYENEEVAGLAEKVFSHGK